MFEKKEFLLPVAAIMALGIGFWYTQNRMKSAPPERPLEVHGSMPASREREVVPPEGQKNGESCAAKSEKSMTLEEAKKIASQSECGEKLKETHFCNENTGTWWIDLALEKKGCSPACVINVETKKAEINWRCTGLIENKGQDLNHPGL